MESFEPKHWGQGEHVAVIGDTQSGKTFLVSRLVRDYQPYTIVVRTKEDDGATFPGARYTRNPKDISAHLGPHWVLGAGISELGAQGKAQQRAAVREVIRQVWRERAWCVVFDELYYCTEIGLEDDINSLLTQGAGRKITVVCGMQRPAHISRFALSSARHVFVFQQEGRDIKNLSEAFSPQFRDVCPTLKRYQFAYMDRSDKRLRTGRAQHLDHFFVPRAGVRS